MSSSCVKKIGWRRWQLHACMMTYQKAFTRLKMHGHEDSGPDCRCNFRNRCCIPQRYTLRDWKHLTFWHIHLLCISSSSKQCTHLQREAKELLSNKIWDCMLFPPPCGNPCCCCSTTKKLITIYNNQASKASSSSSSSLLQAYLVSDFPFGNSRADALYGSRDFKAQVQRSAWRWRIVALSLHDVCSVQCSRSRFDEHFSLACFRIRDLPELQDFRTAWLGNLDGPHLVVVAAAANLVETISLSDGLSTPESNLFLFLFSSLLQKESEQD